VSTQVAATLKFLARCPATFRVWVSSAIWTRQLDLTFACISVVCICKEGMTPLGHRDLISYSPPHVVVKLKKKFYHSFSRHAQFSTQKLTEMISVTSCRLMSRATYLHNHFCIRYLPSTRVSAIPTSPVTAPLVIYTPFFLVATSVILLYAFPRMASQLLSLFCVLFRTFITNSVRRQVSFFGLHPVVLFSNNALIHPCLSLHYSPFLYFSQPLYWKMFSDYI
jgi:hypothetical protein